MEAYQIILLIVCLIVFIYLILLIFVVTNAFTFRRNLKRKGEGIAIIFAQKQEILLSLFTKLGNLGVNFTPADSRIIDEIKSYNFAKFDKKLAKKQSDSLKQGESHFIYLLSINRWAKRDKAFEEGVEMLEDLESAFRLSSSLYNADAQAYNYWLAIPFTSWVCFLVGCRKVVPF